MGRPREQSDREHRVVDEVIVDAYDAGDEQTRQAVACGPGVVNHAKAGRGLFPKKAPASKMPPGGKKASAELVGRQVGKVAAAEMACSGRWRAGQS